MISFPERKGPIRALQGSWSRGDTSLTANDWMSQSCQTGQALIWLILWLAALVSDSCCSWNSARTAAEFGCSRDLPRLAQGKGRVRKPRTGTLVVDPLLACPVSTFECSPTPPPNGSPGSAQTLAAQLAEHKQAVRGCQHPAGNMLVGVRVVYGRRLLAPRLKPSGLTGQTV